MPHANGRAIIRTNYAATKSGEISKPGAYGTPTAVTMDGTPAGPIRRLSIGPTAPIDRKEHDSLNPDVSLPNDPVSAEIMEDNPWAEAAARSSSAWALSSQLGRSL